MNDLPDDAFACIQPGGHKDASGKMVPRKLRHFPIHDKAHVESALARLSQSAFGGRAKAKVLEAAHEFGIHLDEEHLTSGRAARQLMECRGCLYAAQERDFRQDRVSTPWQAYLQLDRR